MPYANEHACRLQTAEGDCFSEDAEIDDKPVRLIICENGRSAIRFSTDDWTEAAAETACDERDGNFEAALPSKVLRELLRIIGDGGSARCA